MVRSYKMKGQKRKKKEEKYDKEEDVEQVAEKVVVEPQLSKKLKTEASVVSDKEEEKVEQAIDESPGIPIIHVDTGNKPGVIFILEKASLEIAKVGKSYQLLSSEVHSSYLVKNKRNPADYRPDIAFQENAKEETKEEEKKEGKVEEKKEEKADEKKEEEAKPPAPCVLFVDLHCMGCAKKIERSITKIKGVESVVIDMAKNEVTIKGVVEPQVVCNKIMTRTKRNAKVLSPNLGGVIT